MECCIYRKCASVFACVLAFGAAVHARTIHVGGDAEGGYPSIKSAVEAAVSGDVIVVAEGFYTGSGNRDITIRDKAITIRSEDPNDPAVVARTVIDCQGGGETSHRAFDLSPGAGTRLVILGLTITNGSYHMSGGALFCEGAEFHAVNCTFSYNRVGWWGGALSCHNSRIRVVGCTFSNNISEGSLGAAIFCAMSDLELENCRFESNHGCAIENHDSSITLARCVFQDNTGKDGGAMHNRVDTVPHSSVQLALSGCTFATNVATGTGGALYNYEVSPTIEGCTFTANTAAKDGGAIANYRSNLLLSNCVLAGNRAAGLGGAVICLHDSTPRVVNCTFVANHADRGGALAGKGRTRLLISHSVLWDNTAGQGPSLCLAQYAWGDVQAASATVECCNVEGGRGSVSAEPECVLTWPSSNIDAEPLFTGPTYDDYRLSPDSPCIDAGDPNYAPPVGATDFDEQPRKFGAAVDLGAFEFRGIGPIHHFWSPTGNRHFYTLAGSERDAIVTEFYNSWAFEGVAYYAFYQPVTENLLPVYRFWSAAMNAHFWTIDEQERVRIQEKHSNVWAFEGVAFYAYPRRGQPLGTLPVYRFWSNQLHHHFYTMDEAEKNEMIENHADLWEFEGPAWYAYPKPHQLGKAGYTFTGDTWCTLTLAASVDGQEAQIDMPDVTLSPAPAQMQMAIDFHQLTTTLDRLSVQTEMIEHTTEISVPGTNVAIPMTFTTQASFLLPTRQGPFEVDPTTGLFANFVRENQNLPGGSAFFTCCGSVSLGDKTANFERTMPATRFEMESFGGFESLALLPNGLYANLPLTFQWHRQQTRDLLAESSVDGRRVQIYVVYSYVGTQGLWRGKLIEY